MKRKTLFIFQGLNKPLIKTTLEERQKEAQKKAWVSVLPERKHLPTSK